MSYDGGEGQGGSAERLPDGNAAPSAPPLSEPPLSGTFSRVLRDLPSFAQGSPDGPLLARVLDRLGARAHGAAILILALPEAVPLPIPSVGAILGVPLIVVSAHLMLYGESGRLPRRILRWRIPMRVAEVISHRIAPVLARAEGWSRPRLQTIASRERLSGLVCLALSVMLFLPIPLMNVPVAMALVALAWGLVQRDGLIVAAGLCLSVVVLGIVVVGSTALLGLIGGAV